MTILTNKATNPDQVATAGTTTVLTNFLGNSRGPSTTYWNVSPGVGGSATREAVLVGGPDPSLPEGGGFIRYTQTVANTGGSCGAYYRDTAALTPGVAGDTRVWQAWVRPSVSRQFRMSANFKDNAAADVTTGTSAFKDCPAGEWTQLPDLTVTATGDYMKLQAWPVTIGPVAAGETFDVVAWVTQVPWPLFDGYTPNNDEFSTSWVGSPGVSLTTLTANLVAGAANSAGTGGALRVWQSLDAPMNSTRSIKSVQTVASTGGSAGLIVHTNVPGLAGDVLSASCWVKFNTDRYVRLLLRALNGSTLVSTDLPGTVFVPANTWTELKIEGTQVNGDYTRIQIWPWLQAPTGLLAVGDTMQLARILVVDGAKLPPDGWWDGDEPGSGKYVFAWDGAPNASTSTRMTRIDLIHWWTRMWYGRLPAAYQDIDAVIQPENGSYPLLRFMDGAGQVSGRIRDLSDLMRSGNFMDPTQTPDYAVRWLAQLMGVTAAQRALDVAALRTYMQDLVTSGRPAVGTTQSIVDATKRFLVGERQVTVVPSPTTAHTILVLVRTDEVPSGNLTTLVNQIRSTGVVPAGHNLVAQFATATWDSYEAAVGATWSAADANQPTWRAADSLGITLS
ncbi:hypothetical protein PRINCESSTRINA_40 [Arthrobacter phage PrincessTrina]|uniref:Minor tail protein n=2 Tax=Klausavirus princesstrina TaxID=1984784 RepID=A0A0U4B579_9CAUD|nr:tail protein [Arthrobacter phage PrincessTrina]ALY09886.1 hypothetical protein PRINCESSTRINA_40 [Arthrobacter phage PrincessTrina]QEQ94541.1 hypothetical protein SEA_LINUS_40 [Arthrobacter phage Linus]